MAVLAVLGAVREIIGNGTLLGGIDMIIEGAKPLQLFGEHYPGFLVAILPPGAFFALGCLIALRNWIDARAAARRPHLPPPVAVPQTGGSAA